MSLPEWARLKLTLSLFGPVHIHVISECLCVWCVSWVTCLTGSVGDEDLIESTWWENTQAIVLGVVCWASKFTLTVLFIGITEQIKV